MAIQPVRWPAWSQWRQVLVRTWKEAGDDNVGFLAAGVAFFAFLAFVPLLASVVLVYGLAADPPTVAEHIGKLFATLPRDAASLISDQLKSLTQTPKSAKGLSLAVAIAIAVYGASKGASGLVTALNIAYEVKETRGFVKTTAVSLAMTVGGLLVLLLAGAAIAASAAIERLLPFSSPVVHLLLQALFWGLTAFAVALGLAAVYRFAPSRPDAPWMWVTPGSAAATLLWLLGTIGFGLYVSHFGSYNKTYGSLGGVVVFLTWLYLSAYIVIMGGELNSELERQQAMEAKDEPALAPAATPAPAATAPAIPPGSPAHRRRIPAAAAILGGLVALRLLKRREKSYDRRFGPDFSA
ncbi:MAG: YihY/virulence factor BrkB family protein [Alphaproteobacteria bacterium]|nr:YihY/virulence factor BrkB family protein [Alphaproteobacteria bacterium]MBV9370716.1 YihY/virulence factor BrkB family protein [Alphaproteobacteria bacterium]MBV9900813.1 YihY/virulence factor BrkB family protein [Alphaproteobacteria bacterium]